jgi:hypothetical protein
VNYTYKIILGIILITGLYSCSSKIQPYSSYSGEVNFLFKEEQGTMVVESTGYGKYQSEAAIDAQISAIKVLLFKGLPGTELNVPLIENENDAKSKHNDYFQNLFQQGSYMKFIMSSTESTNPIKKGGNKTITLDIKINYNSLRIDLEQNQIIRKFGY